MKKIYLILLLLIALSNISKAQVLWMEGFETTTPNNLPEGWSYWDNRGNNVGPDTNWTVRDSGAIVPGINALRRAIPFQGLRLCGVSWLTSDTANIADAWLVTKRLVNVPGDGLLGFFVSGGNSTLIDTLQLWVSAVDSMPASFLANPSNYIQTLSFGPNPVYPTYIEYFIDLAPYAGQTIWIGFRYYVDATTDGVYVQIDNVTYTGTVGITQNGINVPDKFSLRQNYPNPFNPTTKINFDLAKSTNVKLTVFNSLGQMVMNIFEGFKTAGSYQADFNGSSLSSGTYYYRLDTDFYTETKKMQLIK
ncbi:MAG: choice-of-anchor J domain-containing protein [bacterium]